jgi:hypothetical protein
MIEANNKLVNQLNSTKTFSEYMNSTTLYDFRNNIVDLAIIIELYKEQQKMFKIILETFDYMNKTSEYFLNIFDSCNYIDSKLVDKNQYKGLSYLNQLPLIVKNARTHLYKLKLIINFPILITGKYIIPSEAFDRPVFDLDGNQIVIDDIDFYLLNKKLELSFGYETKKVNLNNSLLTDITQIVKTYQGIGLSDIDKTTLGTYIETVERRAIIEYDDFFMLSYWVDYLTKLL